MQRHPLHRPVLAATGGAIELMVSVHKQLGTAGTRYPTQHNRGEQTLNRLVDGLANLGMQDDEGMPTAVHYISLDTIQSI